jgi:hypothetical protein
MIYLIVGVDRQSFAPWHDQVAARDIGSAMSTACARARGRGCELVVAAVIGPNSTVLAHPAPAFVADPIAAPMAAPSRAA